MTEMLAVLNCEQRQVLELVFFKEMTLKEIADETKQTFGNVRNHYYRGLRNFGVYSREGPIGMKLFP